MQTTSFPGGSAFLRRLLIWLVVYSAALFIYHGHYQLISGVVIGWLQVQPSVWLLGLTLPGVDLWHTDTSIACPGLEMQIWGGCDGMEALLLLVTALLIFPMPWRHRGQGILLGGALLWVLNVVRIVTLFHVALRKMDWFDAAHGLVWQTLIILAASAFILYWLAPQRVRAAAAGVTP